MKYIGVLLSADGKKIDPEIISLILSIDTPKCKEDLQRFLGMITHVGIFIGNLSQETALLRDYLKNIQYLCEVFKRLKLLLTSAPVLKLFNPPEHVTTTCDVSQHGLGAALTQCIRPVEFESRSLTSAEKNYVQIKKELFSCC